jgi:hypothetical protein
MWTEIKTTYRDSWKVAWAFPLLFALPAAAELAQHIAEYEIGMFTGMQGMKAAADNGWRMGFGMVKLLSLFLLGYWVSRALALLHGAQLRVSGDRDSARLFVGVLAWSIGTGMLQLFGGDLIAPFVPNPKALIAVGAAFGVALLVCDMYLNVWKVGASLGNARLTPAASFRIMHGNFWWSLGYFAIMSLPALALHYALNFLAVGRPPLASWTLLGVDALTVGYLGIVLVASIYMIARRSTARQGAALLP